MSETGNLTDLSVEEREKSLPEPQDQLSKEERPVTGSTSTEEQIKDVTISPELVENLTIGVLGHYLPNLQKAKTSLDEILKNQTILLDTITQEERKFSDCKAMEDLTESMLKARRYYQKLNGIKKEMQLLSEKSFKLKKRALKLQQQKQKEELQREQQKEREFEREKMLTATVATKANQKSS